MHGCIKTTHELLIVPVCTGEVHDAIFKFKEAVGWNLVGCDSANVVGACNTQGLGTVSAAQQDAALQTLQSSCTSPPPQVLSALGKSILGVVILGQRIPPTLYSERSSLVS